MSSMSRVDFVSKLISALIFIYFILLQLDLEKRSKRKFICPEQLNNNGVSLILLLGEY